MGTTRQVKWVAKLGKVTNGTPTIAGGRVFIGTNNGDPRDSSLQRSRRIDVLRREHGEIPLAARGFEAIAEIWRSTSGRESNRGHGEFGATRRAVFHRRRYHLAVRLHG